MESLHQRLGPHAKVRDLVKLGEKDTLQYDPYEDELQNAETLTRGEPRLGGLTCKCRNILPRGDRIVRGQVVYQKHDAQGNPIDRSYFEHTPL